MSFPVEFSSVCEAESCKRGFSPVSALSISVAKVRIKFGSEI